MAETSLSLITPKVYPRTGFQPAFIARDELGMSRGLHLAGRHAIASRKTSTRIGVAYRGSHFIKDLMRGRKQGRWHILITRSPVFQSVYFQMPPAAYANVAKLGSFATFRLILLFQPIILPQSTSSLRHNVAIKLEVSMRTTQLPVPYYDTTMIHL